MKIGRGILRGGKKLRLGHVKVGLQLDEDHIRQVLLGPACLSFCYLPVTTDSLHGLLAVAVGLVNACVEQAGHKAVGKTVILVGKGNVPEIVGHHPLVQGHLGDEGVGSEAHHHAGERQDAVHLSLKLAAPPPHGDTPHDDRRKAHDHQHQLHGIKIVVDKGQALASRLQILGIKGCHPDHQHVAVGHTQHQPEHADDDAGEDPPPHQVHDRKGHKDHKRIVEEHKG